jgi:hypothetical protein
MRFFQDHQLAFVSALLARHFLVLWLSVAAVLIGCWLVLMRTRLRARFMGAVGNNPFAAFASLFVVSYLLLLVILIPWHAHLIWRDNPNIVGPWGVMRPYINAMGRYTPMAHQGMRAFSHFLDGDKDWFTVMALLLVLTCAALFFLIKQQGALLPALTGVLVAATDVGVATVYSDTIFSEPAVIAGFLLFAYGSLQYRKHHDAPYALVAALGAHVALYTKEVSFTFLAAGSVTYILADLSTKPRTSLKWQNLWKDYAPELLVLVMCCGFLLMYALSTLPIRQGRAYAENEAFHWSYMLRTSLRQLFNYRIVLMILAIPLFLVSKVRQLPNWASYFALAAGSLAYVAAYSVLGLVGYYYTAPAIVAFALVLGWVMASLLAANGQKLAFLGAIALVLLLETFPIALVDRLGKNESDVDHSSYVLPKAVAAILDYRVEMAQLYQAAVYLRKLERENPGPTTVVLEGQYPWMVKDFLLYARRVLGVRVVRADQPQEGDYVAVLSRDRRHVEEHFGGAEYRQVWVSHDVFGGVFSAAQAKKRSYVFQYIGRE